MRVAFMGTPDFAVPCLQALIEADFLDVVGVVSQPDRKRGRGQKVKPTPVKKRALKHDIEVFQPEKVSTAEGIAKLEEWNPEVIVVVAYGQILKEEVLNLPKYGCINIHASLLPKYRGAAPIHRAIIDGEEKTGITTMHMDKGMDTGDMILKEELEISPEDTVGTLHDKLSEIGANLIVETLKQIEAGSAPREQQDDEQATYAPKISKQEGLVDWSKDVRSIWNLIRGMNPWPGSYTYQEGSRLKLWNSKIYDNKKVAEGVIPGTVVKVDDELGIVVQTGEGQLLLTEVQPASKQRIDATDYLRGYDIRVGSKLGE
ncbi:methionyl-tRNA formyltransferase [Orenia metallireducens]|jgi:methionyl-tRNA formyltransferase|uniref:Methionyl-tRNA formyltransferase n=1 Tax=Orenia metallireducens TaxID=1413210 RepID=A0A1C0AC25_9FIRM|nr:methionyl-tRNA formyltransferase [Orenia metallireducens]OCL27936.1 methionyl-tRNA formyltransferase [Orenia metallireducens]